MRPELVTLLQATTTGSLTVNPLAHPVIGVDWPELAAVLPDGGFPIGVVEVSAPRGLGGLTRVAIASVRTAQHADEKAWCAWIDSQSMGSIYAPGLLRAGVVLERLLVVRPPPAALLRSALKVTGSGAFKVVVIDALSVPERHSEVWVRRLALLAEKTQSTVLLLTDSLMRRTQAWPVSLRLELARLSPGLAKVRVGKDRHGRMGQESELSMGV